ncbi:hypothetical protein [Pseudomonas phage vB_PseuGesM_254]|uniref:Uncharacterized protein n=1 Tax=Pseudomonas phage vB_PseuGesM_254 TaxID=3092638 RepID=A0AAX4G6I4_9CAUD|nr:hypothetical protein [Pseudomonas phage PseuGes_254]
MTILKKGDLVVVNDSDKEHAEYFKMYNSHIKGVEKLTFRITNVESEGLPLYHLETTGGLAVEGVFIDRVVPAPKQKKEKKVKNVKVANANKVYAVVLADSGYVLGLRADRESARELKAISGGAKAGVVIQQYAPSKIIR